MDIYMVVDLDTLKFVWHITYVNSGFYVPLNSGLRASLIHFKGAVAFARYVSNNDNFKKLNFSRKIAASCSLDVSRHWG